MIHVYNLMHENESMNEMGVLCPESSFIELTWFVNQPELLTSQNSTSFSSEHTFLNCVGSFSRHYLSFLWHVIVPLLGLLSYEIVRRRDPVQKCFSL